MSDSESARLQRRQEKKLRNARAKGQLDGILALLRPGDFVIDCGANIGAVAAPLADTGATVQCFEPDPYAFGRLQERFQGSANVRLTNAAVGTEAGSISLMRAANFDDNPRVASVSSTVVSGGRKIDEANTITVDQVDLIAFLKDAIATHGEIALLKMDIEGAELDILEEMERQDLFGPIRSTLVETHERKFPDLAERFAALKARVAKAYPMRKVNLDWI